MNFVLAGHLRTAFARLAALALITLAAMATALPAPADAREVDQSAEEIREYWTPERIAGAKPGELIGAGTVPRAQAAADGSRFAVGNPSAPGIRTHGKVFLTIPGQGDFICSGTVVRSFSRSMVATAGHCVSEGRTFAENWMFVPAYDRGSEPFGRWTAEELGATAGWRSNTDLRFDVGMAVVARNDDKTIEEVVGARKIAFNQPRAQFYTSYGYPAEAPPFEFTGEREFACTSSWRGDDNTFSAPRPMRIACDMTPGSSGGGWVANGTVLSVNSFKAGFILPDNRFMFGPYFGDTVEDVYRGLGGGPVLCEGVRSALGKARKRVGRVRAAVRKARARKQAAERPRARRRAAKKLKRKRRALTQAKAARTAASERYQACRNGSFG